MELPQSRSDASTVASRVRHRLVVVRPHENGPSCCALAAASAGLAETVQRSSGLCLCLPFCSAEASIADDVIYRKTGAFTFIGELVLAKAALTRSDGLVR
jgi:hypothetical protein